MTEENRADGLDGSSVPQFNESSIEQSHMSPPLEVSKKPQQVFSQEEISQRRFYQKAEELNVIVQGRDWMGIEGLVRLTLLQALATVDPESCNILDKNDVIFEMAKQPTSYSCILDGVQFVTVLHPTITAQQSMESLRESIQSRGTSDVKAPAPVTFKFYYTRRMAAILAEEAEKARVNEEEKER